MEDTAPVAVIMAGGSGTRFWPYSTPARPKQFVALTGRRTMLQQTRLRLRGLVPSDRILVLTGDDFVDLARQQLPELPPENVLGEPVKRDTAAAAALAARVCLHRFGDAPLLLVPSDHRIRPLEAFHAAVRSALEGLKTHDGLYTFGVIPLFPATEYGYLEMGATAGEHEGVELFELNRFKEKPDAATAQDFLRTRRYLWNTGVFLWRAVTFWRALERRLPEHAARLSMVEFHPDGRPDRASLRAALEPLEPISVDFGVMEHEEGLRAVRAGFDWSDVGSWRAVERLYEPDREGNRGHVRLHSLGGRRNFVLAADPDETVALLGVDDLVVIRSGKRTLVAHRDQLHRLRDLVVESIHRDPEAHREAVVDQTDAAPLVDEGDVAGGDDPA